MNTLFRHAAVILCLSAFVSISTTASAQNFYKWVDSKGTTHYTQTPPPQGAKTTGQVRTFAGPSTTQIQERTETPSTPSSQAPNTAPAQKPDKNTTQPQSPKKVIEVEAT